MRRRKNSSSYGGNHFHHEKFNIWFFEIFCHKGQCKSNAVKTVKTPKMLKKKYIWKALYNVITLSATSAVSLHCTVESVVSLHSIMCSTLYSEVQLHSTVNTLTTVYSGVLELEGTIFMHHYITFRSAPIKHLAFCSSIAAHRQEYNKRFYQI